MLELIKAIVGWGSWVVGVYLAIGCLYSKYYKDAIFILFFVGLFGMAFNVGGFYSMDKVTSTTYESPTCIIKTNNITLVHYIKDGVVVARLESGAIDYWNATNIMVKIVSGVNLYNKKVDDKYEIVIGRN